MKTFTPLAQACLGAIALSLAGCAHVPPDQQRLPQRDAGTVQLAADIRLAREGWPEAQWWTVYHDAQLNALIAQALASAPSLEVAAANIGSAHAALSRSGAELGIDTDLYAGANRQRYSGTGLFPAPIGGASYSEETVRLEAAYRFDWWGKNRAQIAAAVGEVNANRAAYAQAEQSLASAIAQSYFRLQGGWSRAANLEQRIAVQNALVQDQARRIAHGLASADQGRAAELALRQLTQQLEQLKADNGREREALRALIGADASALTDLKPQPMSSAPHALPARLGIELLARRPDLQAARWKVEASLSRTEAAQAAFYPDVNLSASVGLDTISYEHLLQAASRTFYVGPTLTLPLFDSKRLSAQLETARSARNEAIAQYNQAVVQAVRDVAQGALQLQGLERAIVQQNDATVTAGALLHSAQQKLAHGLGDQASVLNARAALLQQQNAALSLRQTQLLAEVTLNFALGGGYQATAGAVPSTNIQNTQ